MKSSPLKKKSDVQIRREASHDEIHLSYNIVTRLLISFSDLVIP